MVVSVGFGERLKFSREGRKLFAVLIYKESYAEMIHKVPESVRI
jgi:hypothetical protein